MAAQVIQIPLTGGLKQSVATEYLDPTQNLITVQNGTYQKDGAVQKRPGVAAVTGGAAPVYPPGDPVFGVPKRLITRRQGQELAAINGDGIYSVSPSTGVIASRGLVPGCVATREHIVGGSQPVSGNQAAAFSSPSVAVGGGFQLIAYRDQTGASTSGLSIVSGALYVTLKDANGAVLIDSRYISGNQLAPTAVIVGGYGYVFVGTANTGDINCYTINLATLAVAFVNVVSDALSGYENVFTATPYVGGGTGILFFYGQASSADSVPRYARMESLPAMTLTGAAGLQAASGIVYSVACRHDQSNTGLAWFGWELVTSGPAETNYAAVLAVPAWTTTHAAFSVIASPGGAPRVGVEPMNATQCCYTTAYSAQTITTSGTVVAGTILSILGLGATSGDPFIISRPFRVTSGGVDRIYAMVSYYSASGASGAQNGSYILLDLRAYETSVPLRVVAAMAPRQADLTWVALGVGLPDYNAVSVTGIGQPTAGTFQTLLGITGTQEELTSGGVESTSFMDLGTLDFTGDAWDYCEAVDESFVACGAPSFYDGSGMQEMGFFQWPQGVTVSFAGTSGSLSAGSYTWAILYSGVDNAQQIWRSTYFLTTGTALATQTATLVIPPLPFSNRFLGGAFTISGARVPMIEVYRNTQAAQTIYYFVGSVPCPALQVGGGAYPSAVSFADGASDTLIGTNPLLYTTGGLLDSINPPSFRCILRHNERVWGIDDSGFVVWYSTLFTSSVAPYFNEALTLQFSEGPLTALGELDGNLIAFSANLIWSVAGDGPPLTGQGSTLTTAVPVPTPVGCASWQSLVSFAQGLMFQAPSGGMYLLDRSLNVTYLKECQDIINASVTVVSAALVPGQSVLRFVLSSGTVVTYDWSFTPGRWATASYPASVNSIVVAGGACCFAGADGSVYVEKSSSAAWANYDTGANGLNAWVYDVVTFADFKPSGIQGWAEWEYGQFIARSLDPCDVSVTMTYDYGGATESRTFTQAALASGSPAAPGIVMGRYSPKGSNGQPMAVRISLASLPPSTGSTSTGAGNRWLGIAFKVSQIGAIYDRLGAGVKQ